MFSIVNYLPSRPQWIDFATTQLDYAAQAVQSNFPHISVFCFFLFFVLGESLYGLQLGVLEKAYLLYIMWKNRHRVSISKLWGWINNEFILSLVWTIPVTVRNCEFNKTIFQHTHNNCIIPHIILCPSIHPVGLCVLDVSIWTARRRLQLKSFSIWKTYAFQRKSYVLQPANTEWFIRFTRFIVEYLQMAVENKWDFQSMCRWNISV